jgi:hypothetical protein
MKYKSQNETGSVLICAVLTLFIVALIGANVLYNCTTRYNVTTRQVKAWKDAIFAAEAGADVGYAAVRSVITASEATVFTAANGWSSPASSPVPTPGASYQQGPIYLGQNNTMQSTVVVNNFGAVSGGVSCYRIRSIGTVQLQGLPRVGMDDRMNTTTRGDSLIRKIDFTYDHFKSTYGDGDGNGAAITAVANPQITRRIETIAVPLWAFTGALKATGTFNGPGSAGLVDSYDSKNGAYSFVANNPASPLYAYSQQGDVEVGSSTFNEGGPIYGNVTTNGGNVTHQGTSITGTIDNNVPLTVPNLIAPSTAGFTSTNAGTLTIPATATAANPATYVYSSNLPNLTVNGATVPAGLPNAGKPAEVYVTIVVNGNITNKITLAKGVNAKIYFTGNWSDKASDVVTNSVDGAAGTYNVDGTVSADYSRAGHMQFYGISPTDGSTQTIAVASPGVLYCTFYAPSANFTMGGNPDIFGAIVCKNFTGNGNTGFHYDMEMKQLGGIATDYQIGSYVEDVR